mgnify:CR=1 FL=1
MVRARVLPLQRRQCRKPERASMRCCALARSRTSTVFHINRNSRKKCETYFASIGFYMRGISDTIKSLCPPSRHKTIETQVFSQHFPAILFIIQYGDLPKLFNNRLRMPRSLPLWFYHTIRSCFIIYYSGDLPERSVYII